MSGDSDGPDEGGDGSAVSPDQGERARFAFESLLQIRDLENQLQWTRSNLILAVQAGLLTLLSFSVEDSRVTGLAICLAGIGMAWAWVRLTMGGSFWIAFWQQRLREVEPHALGAHKIFRDHPNFDAATMVETHNRPKYVSTRKTLLIMARTSVLLWLALFFYVLVR